MFMKVACFAINILYWFLILFSSGQGFIMCTSSWPETYCVYQVVLELRET